MAGVHTGTVPLFASQQSEAWLPGPTQLPRATPRPELDFPRPSRGGGESDMAGEGWHTAQQPRLYPPVSGLARPPSLGRPPWGCTRVEVAMSLPEAQVQAPGPAQILKCNFTQFFATHTHTQGTGVSSGRQAVGTLPWTALEPSTTGHRPRESPALSTGEGTILPHSLCKVTLETGTQPPAGLRADAHPHCGVASRHLQLGAGPGGF